MTISKSDAQKIITQSKQIVDILEMNKLTNPSLAAKYVADAIKNQHTIIVIEK